MTPRPSGDGAGSRRPGCFYAYERCGAYVLRGDPKLYWKHCTSGRDGLKVKADVKWAMDRTYCVAANTKRSLGDANRIRKVTIEGRC